MLIFVSVYRTNIGYHVEKDLKKEDSANHRNTPPRNPAPRRPAPAGNASHSGAPGPATPVPLDEKDKAILRLLQENAKMTVREIAAQVHLSTTPVHERSKRMEDEGVIIRYATLVDHP